MPLASLKICRWSYSLGNFLALTATHVHSRLSPSHVPNAESVAQCTSSLAELCELSLYLILPWQASRTALLHTLPWADESSPLTLKNNLNIHILLTRKMVLFRERDRDTERDSHSLRSHSLSGCKNWGWTRLNTGARNSYWVSSVSGRGTGSLAISAAFPGSLIGGGAARTWMPTTQEAANRLCYSAGPVASASVWKDHVPCFASP